MALNDRTKPRFRLRSRWLPWLSAFFLVAAAFFYFQHVRPRPHTLRMTGGDTLGRRHLLATLLAEEGTAKGLRISVRETTGSEDALKQIQTGKIDLAFVQGGQDTVSGVRLIAALHTEPLHLLVKKEIAPQGIAGLRGKRLNLSTQGSGTRRLANQALAFAGMTAERDFTDEDRPYAQLKALSYDALPDAVFLVSTMASPVAEFLVQEHGFQFLPLLFGDALALREAAIIRDTIPAYSYGVVPPMPPKDIPTVGNRMLLVAGERVPPAVVRQVLETIFQTEFLHRANLPPPDEKAIIRAPEMPVHPGAAEYLTRNDPFLTAAAVQSLESLRSFLVSLAIALFFLVRWSRRRRFASFDHYISEVTQLEKRALAQEISPDFNLKELIGIRNRLSAIKTEALEKFARGQLRGEEMMTGFLAHTADVRNYVTALILHERERIAEQSADEIPDVEQEARFRAEWSEAVSGAEEWEWRDAPMDAPPPLVKTE
jgi:TRAP transporter TAXI family solute receptor